MLEPAGVEVDHVARDVVLTQLGRDGFDDDQVLFTYRSFNAFLLGFLLLETGAMVSDEPRSGDGSLGAGGARSPVPGAPSPTCTDAQQRFQRKASTVRQRLDPFKSLEPDQFPAVDHFAKGLTQNPFEAEFAAGLDNLIARVTERLEQN